MVRGLLVYARAELWLPWSRRFFAFDVCPSGHASGSWNVERQSVRDVAAWSERWKYKEDLEGGSARERALRRAVLEVRAARAEEPHRELAGPDLTITNDPPRCRHVFGMRPLMLSTRTMPHFWTQNQFTGRRCEGL